MWPSHYRSELSRRNGLAVAALLAGALAVSACPAPHTRPLPLITPVEAVHLVEKQLGDVVVGAVTETVIDGNPGYVVEGSAGGEPCRAEVDAKVARTLRITRGEETVYEWPGIVVVGHRGTVSHAPENTVAAIEKVMELGADLIEIDIRESKDGHLVIIHDASVERTTDGTGLVADMTLAELKALDAGSWFDEKFAGEKIPTLEEALDAMKGRALPDLDFKAGAPEKLVEAVERHGLLGEVTLYCGPWTLLRATLEVSREFRIRPTVPYGRMGLPMLLEEFDPPIVNIDWAEFSEPLVRDVHLLGRKAFLNTMGANDTEFGMLRAIEAGADYLQTDHLDVLLPLLRERGLHK